MSKTSHSLHHIRVGHNTWFAWLLFAAVSLPLATCLADETNPSATIDQMVLDKVERLIEQLDSDEFDTREAATKSLIELDEIALALIPKQLANDALSNEARRRCQTIVDAVKKRIVSRNPVTVADFFDDVAKTKTNSVDWQLTQARLTRLIEILRYETKNEKLKTPVDVVQVANNGQGPRGMRRNGLFVDSIVTDTFAREGMVIGTTAITMSHVSNSVLITPGVCDISHADNCIIIAGRSTNVSHLRNSIIISGEAIRCSFADDCIFAAREPVEISLPRKSYFINCHPGRTHRLEESTQLTVPALIMPPEPPAPVLKGKLTITTLMRELVLYKLPDGTGEYVIRKGNGFQRPDGTPIEPLLGWKLVLVGSRIAAFEKDEQVCYLPISK